MYIVLFTQSDEYPQHMPDNSATGRTYEPAPKSHNP
ncbi:hypothetical protein F383_27526 [Gossypium arboreum]|uniref:Uncharacterized protein n=1 Tax=Gossypium arboreum TaxID=29729 RepID=A0A0B0P4H2_GOSAR|nr:hypothetical protein F383_27526 [Gossypium arboreum]